MQKWQVKFIDDRTGVCYCSCFVRTNEWRKAVSLARHKDEQINLAISRLSSSFNIYLSIRVKRVGKMYPLSETIL